MRRLLVDGWRVLATKRPQSLIDPAWSAYPQLQWVEGDTGSAIESWFDESDSIEAIFHLATDYGRSQAATIQTFESNLVFPMRLLDAALRYKTPLFLNTDTCFRIDYPYLQSYTLSKKQFVAWGKLLAETSPIHWINLELQHPYGPGDRPGKFVPWIIDQVRQDGPPIPLTTGEQQKDFIYVDDVVQACLTILEARAGLEPGFHHIECGTGNAIAVRDFVERVHRICQSNRPLAFGALPTRDREVMHSVANVNRLRSLGWQAQVSLDGHSSYRTWASVAKALAWSHEIPFRQISFGVASLEWP